MRRVITDVVIVAMFLAAGCGKKPQSADVQPLVFWHTQSDQNGRALREIVEEYNATKPAIPVREEYVGDYDSIFRKTLPALMAKRPPDLAVAYESMVAEYMTFGAVVDLGPYLDQAGNDMKSDTYASFLESNRFAAYGGKLLSMPFTKSVLMLYVNREMLEKVRRTEPPGTWEEFVTVCSEIKSKLNVSPLAFARDASTFDGLVFSFGGELYDAEAGRVLFDQPAAVNALKLLSDLFRRGLAHETAYGTYDDRGDFAQQRSAFFLRSSTSRPYIMDMIKDRFRWDMAMVPHGADARPATVLFGANICVFKSSAVRERAAWDFIRYFTSRDVTARWATRTGYLPVRKSALETAVMKEFVASHPANVRAIDAIPFAKPEPSVRGWQEIRDAIDTAMLEVITARQSPEQAAQTLQDQANKALAAGRH